MSSLNASALAACAAIALLAGCAGSLSHGSALPSQGAGSGAASIRHSWMDAGLSKQDLLYVSNTNGEVTVYRYWLHTLVGVLTNFTQPLGECADKSNGNVFITDYSAKTILEFAHGGTKPIKKLSDSPNAPYSCSVDSATHDLAVADYNGSSQKGDVAVWTNASGSPKRYTDSQLSVFKYLAYDDNGALLVTDGGGTNAAQFAWLPKNGSKLINLKVPGKDPSFKWYVTGIQWDGRFFVLDDYYLYRISLIHGQAYYVGMTDLYHSGGGPFWIYNNKLSGQGTQVVGGYAGDSYSWVYYWDYPVGGNPIYQLQHGVDHPVGLTVSLRVNRSS
jgi:hypothetical protein